MNNKVNLIDARLEILEYGQRVKSLLENLEWRPTENSKFESEQTSYSAPEWIRFSLADARISINGAFDFLVGSVSLCEGNIPAASVFVCARGCLETAGTGAYLLDPNIGPEERVARFFASRYNAAREKEKSARETFADAKMADSCKAAVEDLVKQAAGVGVAEKFDKNNHRIGLGKGWPTMTDMLVHIPNGQQQYRLHSAVAHGHHWALADLYGISTIKGTAPNLRYHTILLNYQVCFLAVDCLTRRLWDYMGWEIADLHQTASVPGRRFYEASKDQHP